MMNWRTRIPAELKALRLNVFPQNQAHYVLFTVIGLLFVAMSGIVIHEALESRDAEYEKSRSETLRLTLTIEQYARATFSKIDILLVQVQEVMKNPELSESFKQKRMYGLLKTLQAQVAEVEVIGMTDANGRYTSNTLFSPEVLAAAQPIPSVSDRPYFILQKQTEKDGLVISDPVMGKTTKHLNLVLSRSLRNSQGKFTGIVLASINLDRFSQLFSRLEPSQDIAITLWNSQRVLLARFPFESTQIGKYFPASEELKQKIHSGATRGNYPATSPIDGITREFSFKVVEDLPLVVSVGRSQESFLSPWRHTYLITGFIMLVLSLIIVFAMVRYLRNLKENEANRAAAMFASKMSALGEMSAGVAHEINNPLAIITGHLEKISKELEEKEMHREMLKNSAEKIETMVKRIVKIIQGLKSFSRNSVADPMAVVSLATMIEMTKDLTSERFNFNEVRLTFKAIAGVQIKCRESQISQVLVNLLNNAFDAVSELNLPGREKWVELETQVLANSRVKILITDSGLGISPEIKEKIMSPFFTTKGAKKGTGLGLSISKGIIEQHGGTLSLDTTNAHTCFVIELPFDSDQSSVAIAV